MGTGPVEKSIDHLNGGVRAERDFFGLVVSVLLVRLALVVLLDHRFQIAAVLDRLLFLIVLQLLLILTVMVLLLMVMTEILIKIGGGRFADAVPAPERHRLRVLIGRRHVAEFAEEPGAERLGGGGGGGGVRLDGCRRVPAERHRRRRRRMLADGGQL